MEDETTTVGTDNQDDANKGTTDSDQTTTTTDSGTTTDTTGSDNSDSSTSTDKSDDGDNKSTTDTKDDKNSSAPKFDTDLDEWAEKTKRPLPENDRERALYQEIRDSQREFSRSKQAKDATQSVEKAIETAKPADNKTDDDDDRDPVEKRQDTIEDQLTQERNLRLRGEYFTEKSVTQEQSDVMGKILQEKVDRAKTPEAKKQAYDYWTHPDQLEDWHDLAKARLNNTAKDTSVIEEEAARKERERIAKESQASGGNRNASNNGPAKKQGYNRTEFLKS